MFSQNREKMNTKKRCPLDGDIHASRIEGSGKYGQFVSADTAKERSKVRRRNASKNIIKNELETIQGDIMKQLNITNDIKVILDELYPTERLQELKKMNEKTYPWGKQFMNLHIHVQPEADKCFDTMEEHQKRFPNNKVIPSIEEVGKKFDYDNNRLADIFFKALFRYVLNHDYEHVHVIVHETTPEELELLHSVLKEVKDDAGVHLNFNIHVTHSIPNKIIENIKIDNPLLEGVDVDKLYRECEAIEKFFGSRKYNCLHD